MELTETKIRCLLEKNKLNNLDEGTFERLTRIGLSHICGHTNNTGYAFTIILVYIQKYNLHLIQSKSMQKENFPCTQYV